jgi:hypothetical protein
VADRDEARRYLNNSKKHQARLKKLKTALQPILEGSVKMPLYDDGKSPESIEFFGDLHLDKPENAYHFGFQTALLECGEIIAKALIEIRKII